MEIQYNINVSLCCVAVGKILNDMFAGVGQEVGGRSRRREACSRVITAHLNPPGRPNVELRRGGVPGGALWQQPAAVGGVRAGGGRLRAAAGGHHRGLGGQEP